MDKGDFGNILSGIIGPLLIVAFIIWLIVLLLKAGLWMWLLVIVVAVLLFLILGGADKLE